MTSLETVRARFTSSQGLPFAEVLTEASIREVLDEHKVEYRDRLFGPLTTIWGFLSQVLSADHSCRDAVRARRRVRPGALFAQRRQLLQRPETSAHRRAARLAKRTARQLQDGLPRAWKWNGRDVFIADGSPVSMPDTKENQEAYPQVYNQEPGIASRWPESRCCCR